MLSKLILRGLTPALIAGCWASQAQAHGWELPSVKFHFNCRVTVCSQPQPSAPWWAYFPQNSHAADNAGHAYPSGPTELSSTGPPLPAGPPVASRSNITFGTPASMVQPTGYMVSPPPSYWYGR